MKIIFKHFSKDTFEIIEFFYEKVTSVEFEDQRYCDNGMWLLITYENKDQSYVEFDPDEDRFIIQK